MSDPIVVSIVESRQHLTKYIARYNVPVLLRLHVGDDVRLTPVFSNDEAMCSCSEVIIWQSL